MYSVKFIFSEVELFEEIFEEKALKKFLNKLGLLDTFRYIFEDDILYVYKFIELDNVQIFTIIQKLEPFDFTNLKTIITDVNNLSNLFYFEPKYFYSLYTAIKDLGIPYNTLVTITKLEDNTYSVETNDTSFIIKFIRKKEASYECKNCIQD